MGVPVVTLAQECHASRVGASLLTQIDQSALIANDESSYVETTKTLADDIDRLVVMRESLRSQMMQSPLMDARRLASEVEFAYEQMLQRLADEEKVEMIAQMEKVYSLSEDEVNQSNSEIIQSNKSVNQALN